MARLTVVALCFFSVLFLSYGQLYKSYKFSDPSMGANDFFEYSKMIQSPLDFDATHAPFVFRQIPTLAARLLDEAGFRYRSPNVAGKTSGDTRYFFALILSNYLAAALGIALMCELLTRRHKLENVQAIAAGAIVTYVLVSSQFNFGTHVVAPLTEGWAWLFLCLVFYLAAVRGKMRHGLLLVLPLSIFSRELVVVIFGAVCIFSFLFKFLEDVMPLKRTERALYAALCVLLFGLYVFARKFYFGGEYAHHTDAGGMLETIIRFSPTKEFFMQVLLSQNIFALLVGLSLFKRRYDILAVAFMTFAMLFFMGLGSGIGNNLGRILALCTPLYVFLVFEAALKPPQTRAAGS